MDNPYLELTAAFNDGRLRALLTSGQAVVAHRLAIMSKDGHWILREDEEALDHVLGVLDGRGATYRYGAPLDLRWMAGGWSAHFEYRRDTLRIRTDFVTRPPRISTVELARMWRHSESTGDPVVQLEPLAAMKLTNREKDYAVVGELARRMTDPRAHFRYSRSSRDLIRLAREHPKSTAAEATERRLLARIDEGRDVLDELLDRERRALMRANEDRLRSYLRAAEPWTAGWRALQGDLDAGSLRASHALLTRQATGVLPVSPDAGGAT